jgi:uncharacterized protein
MTKEEMLKKIIKQMESVIIAFSGGLDSTYLAYIAYKVLGDKCLAVTAISPSLSGEELQKIPSLIKFINIRHQFINTNEGNKEEFLRNDKMRCYFCKKELFSALMDIAKKENYKYVVDGSNCDDLDDYRPGRIAAGELSVRSPLIEAGFRKKDIRFYAKKHNLPNWDKPSTPCLASRIPFFSPITEKKLKQIEEAEAFLHQIGCKILRVRHHDTIARIEASPRDLKLILKHKTEIVNKLKSIGFAYITIDLEHYRPSGKIN